MNTRASFAHTKILPAAQRWPCSPLADAVLNARPRPDSWTLEPPGSQDPWETQETRFLVKVLLLIVDGRAPRRAASQPSASRFGGTELSRIEKLVRKSASLATTGQAHG